MDHSTAIIPDPTIGPGRDLGPQLRELRRVLKAVRAGDHGARVNAAVEGPVADVGLVLNELIERHQRAVDRIQHLEDELATVGRFRDEFLANVSHELRTPLNNLLILSGTLSQNQSRNLDPDQVSYATTIFECGRDLLKMINDMLDLGADPHPSPATITPIKVGDLIADLEQFFRPLAAEKNLSFGITHGVTVPPVLELDADRVQQILYNLLSNAFKFTEFGEVRLGLSRNGTVVSFTVTDTGVGIPPDQIDHIFGAFHQVDGSINRGFGGTGLGLTISREFATALGGAINVDSVIGRGSTFKLDLPLNGGSVG